MKKTVNINLAGTFFHIDEDAFAKLQRYLDAIKRSLSDPNGSDEILRDIEARIAELFSEKMESTSQVISIKELDEVIAVMGQPEDYMVDDEIFEDTPPGAGKSKRSSYRQLFRDIDNKFIGGVSAGLGHYLGIDAVWVRLLWILLTIFSSGTFILVYILFWIIVPAAETTSDKLKMTGEPVNISNIEKKFKEGYEAVADKVKNADYDKYGQQAKSGASGFFETLGNILLTLLKIFVKFIGILLIIVSLSTLVGLIIGLFTFGSIDFWGHGEMMDYIHAVDTTATPYWLLALLTMLGVGIPFFVLFILGLKLLINNLKSIGTTAKVVLLILWIASLVGLTIIGLRQATQEAYNGETITERTLDIKSGDTLRVRMRANNQYDYSVNRDSGFRVEYDEEDNKVIYSRDIQLIVRATDDPTAKLVIDKNAEGSSYLDARERASRIEYDYAYSNGELVLDGYFITDIANQYRDQEIDLILYLPAGSILFADQNTYSFHRNYSSANDMLHNGDEEQYLLITPEGTRCLDCDDDRANERAGQERASWEAEVNEALDNGKKVEIKIIEDDLKEDLEFIDSTSNN